MHGVTVRTLTTGFFALVVLSGTGCFLGHPLVGAVGDSACDSAVNQARNEKCVTVDPMTEPSTIIAAVVATTPVTPSGPATIGVSLTGATGTTITANTPPFAMTNGMTYAAANLPANGVTLADSGTYTFTIQNTGTGPLLLSGSQPVAKSGPDAGLFTYTQPGTTTIAAGASTTFVISWSSPGCFPAKVFTTTIQSNSTTNATFTFTFNTGFNC